MRRRDRAKAVVAVVFTLLGVSGIVYLIARASDAGTSAPAADSSTTSTTARLTAKERKDQADALAWDKEAQDAFGGTAITNQVLDMVKGADEWRSGQRATDQYTAELATHLDEFRLVVTRVSTLRAFPFDERVVPLYQHSADLYVEAVRAYQAEVQTPAGPLRDQLDLLARRVRVLGDRVFDRGRALVHPYLHEAPNPNVNVQLPEEVPNWVDEGMAAGPPLDDTPPAPSSQPTLSQADRPQQSRDAWLKALRDARVPSGSELANVLRSGDATSLRDMARGLSAAAERLRPVPDPKGDREESERVRLGLLVQAESARTAQAAALATGPAHDILAAMAPRLALVGDGLWSGPGLPDRRTGLDPALLGEDGKK
ncbi:MAG TPA: hypothetical protein VFA94_09105 [Acidimicrobiales bacterium]|nr:hypothetical protein [Acidimicrobiales bacterium]